MKPDDTSRGIEDASVRGFGLDPATSIGYGPGRACNKYVGAGYGVEGEGAGTVVMVELKPLAGTVIGIR